MSFLSFFLRYSIIPALIIPVVACLSVPNMVRRLSKNNRTDAKQRKAVKDDYDRNKLHLHLTTTDIELTRTYKTKEAHSIKLINKSCKNTKTKLSQKTKITNKENYEILAPTITLVLHKVKSESWNPKISNFVDEL